MTPPRRFIPGRGFEWGPLHPEDMCSCYGDVDDDLLDDLENDDVEQDPCPRCGGLVLRELRPSWMDEEDDC